jgi:hypothetical protein
LRYCQISVLVIRQYPYLHTLEESISPEVGGGDLYQREGKVYLREYPLLLDVAWFAYCILFPIIVIFATFGLAIWRLLDCRIRSTISSLMLVLLVLLPVSFFSTECNQR